MYSKCALSLLVLTGGVLADQSGYSAAGNSYAAPSAAQNSYAAPSVSNSYAAPAVQNNYAAPAVENSYAAPSAPSAPAATYNSAPSYGYDDYSTGYAPVEEADEGKVGFSLEEIIPLFLVVLAAVILAGLLGPLLSQFLMLFVALAPAALNVKAPIINAILAPFNLILCQTAANTAPVAVTGRSFDEWEMDTTYIQLFFNAYDMIMSNMA